jgi:hypothetical protein
MNRWKFFIFLSLWNFMCLNAQSVDESILYSRSDLFGSARYVGLGGAMGALGNDFSALHDNPAGLSVFRRDRAELNMGFELKRTTAEHYGNKEEKTDIGFSLTSGGIVHGIESLNDDFNRYYFGISFRRHAQFDQEFLVSGQNPESSIINQWIYNSNGLPPDQLINDGWLYEGMAWEGFLTDVLDSSTWSYTSYATGLDLQQDRSVIRSGSRDEILLSMAGSFDHRFFYGAGLGIPFLYFNEESVYSESGFDANSDVNDFSLIDRYTLNSIGVNLQIGVQYRINYWWRVGASWRSPSLNWSNARFETELNTQFRDGTSAGPIRYFNDDIRYSLTSPQRFLLSSAFVWNKRGFLSIDYQSIDMSRQRFRSSDLNLDDVEQAAVESLQWQHQIRAGLEYRIEAASLRTGYQIANSPYRSEGSSPSAITTFSIGAGYQFSRFRIDIAWRQNRAERDHYLYNSTFTAPSRLQEKSSFIVVGAFFSL